MDFFFGEDEANDQKDEINTGVRMAVIRAVNLTYDSSGSTEANQKNQSEYGTIDLQMLNPGGFQRRVLIPTVQFGSTSGSLDIPEVGAMAFCIFFPNSRAVCIGTKSMGDSSGDNVFIADLIKAGLLPQLNQGDHAKWSGLKAFSFVRSCAKTIKQTIGTLLDNTKTPITMNGKKIHYNVEHESGTKLQFDEDGNVTVTLAANKKLYMNVHGGTAVDDEALVTRKFLLDFYNDLVDKYNDLVTKYGAHTHVYAPGPLTPIPTAPPTSPAQSATKVATSLPDTVSTPDVRAKN